MASLASAPSLATWATEGNRGRGTGETAKDPTNQTTSRNADDKEEEDKKKKKPRSNLKLPDDLNKDQRAALEKGIESYAEALESYYDRNADSHDTLKRIRRAFKQTRRATVRASKRALSHYYFAQVLQMQKRYKKAEAALEKAVKIHPKFFEAWTSLADAQLMLKKFDTALEHYELALEIYPDYIYGLDRKARALIAVGDFKPARTLLKRAQKKDDSRYRDIILERVRRQIKGPDWDEVFVAETDSYIVSAEASQHVANQTAEQLELINKMFKVLFPKATRPDRKFHTWIFKDGRSYMRGGGIRGAAGDYDPVTRKIFMPTGKSKKDTTLVLNHEAFHQFIDDYAPHVPQRLNEGLAEYFAPFYLKKGAMFSRPNWWRLKGLQRQIRYKRCTPADELMVMTQAEMYAPRKIGTHYAQAWGMLYYMIEDLDEAFAKTFGRVDMDKLETRWQSYVMRLKESGK